VLHGELFAEVDVFIKETRAAVPFRRKCSHVADTPLPVSGRTVETAELPVHQASKTISASIEDATCASSQTSTA
jgi:hypothetical protein